MRLPLFLRRIALVSLLFPGIAFAGIKSINVQTFNPSTSDRFVLLEDGFRSEWPKKALYYFGATYNFVSNPLVAGTEGQTATAPILDSLQTLDLFAGAKLANNFALYLGVPIHYVSFSGNPLEGPLGDYSNETSIGDIKLMGKIRLTNDGSHTAVALIPEVRFATGGSGAFVSDGTPYLGLRGTLERTFEAWTMVINLGYVSAPNSIYDFSANYAPIDFRRRFIAGIGGYLPFNDSWGMSAEINSINMVPLSNNTAPNDFYLGLRHGSSNGLSATAGLDISRIGGPLGQDLRIIAGIRYTLFGQEEIAPVPLPPSPRLIEPKPEPTPVKSPAPVKAPPPAKAPAPVKAPAKPKPVATPAKPLPNSSLTPPAVKKKP